MKRMIKLGVVLGVLSLLIACSMEVKDESSSLEEMSQALVESISNSDVSVTEDSKASFGSTVLPIAIFLDRDATMTVLGDSEAIPLAGNYTGKRDVLAYFFEFAKSIKVRNVEVQELMVEDNNVNLHIKIDGRVRDSGNSFDIEFVWAMEWDGYRISSVYIYYDTHSFHQAFFAPGPVHISDIQNPEPRKWNPWDTNDYRPLIDKGYQAFYFDGDVPTVLSLVDPEIYWVFKGDPDLTPYAGLYFGIDGMLQFFMNIGPNFILQDITFHKTVQHGNRVDVTFTETGLSVATGKTYTIDVMHSFLIEDNKFVEFKTYNDGYTVAQSYVE